MSEHLIDGEFQSDKYPTTPRGKVPLSCKDPTAQPHLLLYALGRHKVDANFAADLSEALRAQGYSDKPLDAINQIILWRIDDLFNLSPEPGTEAGIELDALTSACMALEAVIMGRAAATPAAGRRPR